MKFHSNCARVSRLRVSATAISMALTVGVFSPPAVRAQEPSLMPGQPSKMEEMKGMDGMSMTGDADYDFAINMRKHHQMALTMSESELKNGTNPQMQQMAKNIIAAQKKEIATFDKWIASHKKSAMK
jgi:uncharacterized protein (DUF305 family)